MLWKLEAGGEDKVKILLIADLHVGSRYSVAPENWREHKNNSVQRKIFGEWKRMANSGKYDYLIINGDVVEGLQPANQGVDLWTSDLDLQIDAAAELVKMINYDKLLVTYGTPYHTRENLNADQAFAKQMNATYHNHEINFQPSDSKDIFHISHAVSVSTSSWQYRTTPLAKELVAALLNEKELFKYRGIIRSHAHYFCVVRFSHTFGVITPCWQSRTPYMIRKGLSMIPKLGWLALESIKSPKNWSLEEHTFNMPRLELTKV